MKEKDLTDLRCGDGIFSTSKDDPMYLACSAHDLDYVEGGSEEERIAADENFKKNCEFTYDQQGGFRCWLESWLFPGIVKLASKAIWKPYSRIAEYLKQGREKEKD